MKVHASQEEESYQHVDEPKPILRNSDGVIIRSMFPFKKCNPDDRNRDCEKIDIGPKYEHKAVDDRSKTPSVFDQIQCHVNPDACEDKSGRGSF